MSAANTLARHLAHEARQSRDAHEARALLAHAQQLEGRAHFARRHIHGA